MKVTILSSDNPRPGHGNANELVLFSLLEGLARNGHQVEWAYLGSGSLPKPALIDAMSDHGISFASEISHCFVPAPGHSKGSRLTRWASNFFYLAEPLDAVSSTDIEMVQRRLSRHQTDLVILFWDSWFEYILGEDIATECVAYMAKPRYDAAEHRLTQQSGFQSLLKRIYMQPILSRMTRNHLSRMKQVKHRTNICAQTAKYYGSHGLPSGYTPLTITDFFTDFSVEDRSLVPDTLEIVIGFGNYTGLGTLVGTDYILKEILPRLSQADTTRPYRLNVYGAGITPNLEARFQSFPRVKIHGFVEDIDREFKRNQVYLFCNNVSRYAGTYTRVSYALSAGMCMVGHQNLAQSVPELCSGENCLLGTTPDDITAHLVKLIDDPESIRPLQRAARATFIESFAPTKVANFLISMTKEPLTDRQSRS